MGCKVGKKVFIGYGVWFDFNNAHLIEIGNNVHITNMCLLLCHQRDIDQYKVGDDSSVLPYVKDKIISLLKILLKKNSFESTITKDETSENSKSISSIAS